MIEIDTVHTVVSVEEGVHCDAGGGGLWAEVDLFSELAGQVYFCFDVDALAIPIRHTKLLVAVLCWKGKEISCRRVFSGFSFYF